MGEFIPFITPGRHPTIPEIRAYYNTPAILDELIQAMQLWHVRFVPGCEPQSWFHTDNPEELQVPLNRALDRMEENPHFTDLPYFRINNARYNPAYSWEKTNLWGYDFVIEKDAELWQECFEAMLPVMDILDYFSVHYWLKYTGHHSLHLVIPAEVFPTSIHNVALTECYEVVHYRLMVFLNRRSNQHFNEHDRHCPPGTNMPFSVNEDTGLVNLPLTRKELAGFRPWQSSIHLVEPRDYWRKVPPASIDSGLKLLEEVLKPTRRQRFFYADKNQYPLYNTDNILEAVENPRFRTFCLVKEKAVKQITSPILHLRLQAAWSLMIQSEPEFIPYLVKALSDENPDVRWFAAEGLARVGSIDIINQMLHLPPDDMAGASMVDFCVRLGKKAIPSLIQALCIIYKAPYVSLPLDKALIRLGKSSIPFVKALLEHKKSTVRKTAVDILQRISGTPALDDVLDLTKQHNRKSYAVKMLGWFDNPQVHTRILELSQDMRNDRVRRESVKTLLWNDHPNQKELLTKAREDPNKKIRNWANRYLVLIEQLDRLKVAIQ